MTAKIGAQTPQSPSIWGLERSIVAPRQRDPSFPLQLLRLAALSRLCWSQQHPPSPRVPARCPRENSDTVPSGKIGHLLCLKSQRRRASPLMNLWNQWVSGPSFLFFPPNKCNVLKCTTVTVHHTNLCVFPRTTRGSRKPMRHYVGSWRRQSGRWRY